jgi:hypothetical protein
MINLSEFVNKKVVVRFRDQTLPREGTVLKKSVGWHCYAFGSFLYNIRGEEVANHNHDICEICELIDKPTESTTLKKQLKQIPVRFRIQLFSSGSQRAKLKELVDHFQSLIDSGHEKLEIEFGPKVREAAEIGFYAVKFREETADEYLVRMGLDTKEKQSCVYEALKSTLKT